MLIFEEMMNKKTICLNMIVRNERNVIRRCLSSVKKLIDYWVIVDTGSTDGTQQVILEFMEGIPGELHERAWVDFGHNRNEALALARGRGDYFLVLDADERLILSDGFQIPLLEKDLYYASKTTLFFKDLPDFFWNGPVCEVLEGTVSKSSGLVQGIEKVHGRDGYRSQDPKRDLKDVELLERAAQTHARSLFHLANAYLRIGEYKKALRAFEQRSLRGGRDAEVFYSLFCIGTLQNTLRDEPETFIGAYCKAFQCRPSRIEPLCELTDHFIQVQNYFLAYLISEFVLSVPMPEGDLYLKESLYDWGALWQYFICAGHLGKREQAAEARLQLLANPRLPDEYRSWIEKKGNFVGYEI